MKTTISSTTTLMSFSPFSFECSSTSGHVNVNRKVPSIPSLVYLISISAKEMPMLLLGSQIALRGEGVEAFFGERWRRGSEL